MLNVSVAHGLLVTRIHSFSISETSKSGITLVMELYLFSVVLLDRFQYAGRSFVELQYESVEVVQILA